jgi:diguanylate cyclase (GGDEF)-like protein
MATPLNWSMLVSVRFFAEVIVVNWSALPDLAAVGLLTGAFASVAKRNQTDNSDGWLLAWLMIALHFAASLFQTLPGRAGDWAQLVSVVALGWSGILFMWASVPYRKKQASSKWLLFGLLAASTFYLSLAIFAPPTSWAFVPAALLFGLIPLVITAVAIRKINHPLRWAALLLFLGLSVFLLLVQYRPDNGLDLALNGILFTVFFGCCIHFGYAYRRSSAGSIVTTFGFLAWASVFLVGPFIQMNYPSIHVEAEVWNLPKYLVAVGMILLLLEDQLEHNRHLALHDHLTGLPNRRLYQDRLANALERARRSESHTALLVVDLNGFKLVNDTFGHHIGDLVLQRVGELFSSRVRRSDTVARTGGDEFTIILEEPTSPAAANHVAMSLMHLLDQPLLIGEQTVQIGASVGIAIFPEDARDMESLCIAADLRMYNIKHGASEGNTISKFPVTGSFPALQPGMEAGFQVAD